MVVQAYTSRYGMHLFSGLICTVQFQCMWQIPTSDTKVNKPTKHTSKEAKHLNKVKKNLTVQQ